VGDPPPLKDTATGVDLARRLAPGTVVAGRYRVVATVGIGGMGVVYKARDEELDEDVALKVLRPDLGADPDWVARFRRELVLGRQVTHRNVVRIHDIGESDGLRFLTMRYVEGQSLLEILRAEGSLPVERALPIVRQVAEALQQAHDAGVVHRDLKPGNVLVEADGTAYVTDFGIARSLGRDGLTRTGAVVGTPEYLSPEQVAGDAVDGRSDVYSLGILFYEILTGQLPFHGESKAEILAQRIGGRARDIRETGVAVPPYVRAAIARCLERSPSRRYQSARALIADLDRRRVAGRRVHRGVWLAAGIGVLALAAAWSAQRHRADVPPAGPSAPPSSAALHAVAVLPLSDETADPDLAWTGTGIAEMLAADLSESPGLRVLDAQRVFRSLRDLKLGGSQDERGLRRLAEVLEVDRLIAGNVRKAGPTIRVDLRLVAVDRSGAVATHHVGDESPDQGGLFRLVDNLGDRLRRDLGAEAPAQAEAAAAETTSLAAASAYQEGRDLLARGEYVSAAPAFERAVAADPGFAVALERLAETYQNLGYEEKALSVAERAATAAGAGEARLGYRVRARVALLRGEPAEAEKSYAELARRFPNDLEALLDLSSAQARQGDVARAVETLQKASQLDRSDPRVWFLLGKNTILMGDAGRAVKDHLVRALALHGQLHNEQGQAEVLNAMGVAYHQLGDYPQAIEKYSAAAAIRQRLGDERGVATSLKNRARIHIAMGHFAEAEPDLGKARRIAEKIGDKAGFAEVMNDFGVVHENRGQYAEALAAYQEALKVRRTLGDERLLAQSYDNIGYIYFLEGEYDNALVYWTQALDLRRKVGEKAGVILSQQNLGFLHTAQGRWDEALKTFAGTLESSREIDFKNAIAVSFGNIGLLQQYEGHYGASLASFEEALAVLRALGDKRGLAEFTIKKGFALLELGRLDAAKAALDQAEPWVRETGNREQSADYHTALGEWHARSGHNAQARPAFARAVEDAAASGSRPAQLRARIAEATAHVAMGDAAAGALRPLVREAEALGDPLLRIRAAEAMGRAQLARGRLEEAEDWARRALEAAQRHGWEAGRYRIQALLGSILEKKGAAAAAAREYEESLRGIARLREGMEADVRASFDALPWVREAAARTGHP
jgi:eukaryotic-like serine/threonine-protein kinase